MSTPTVQLAHEGMIHLVDCMRQKTGQSYKVRALLYSLWNGQATSLLEIVGLDTSLHHALADVIRVFGSRFFFYDELIAPIKAAGLFDWFTEEFKEPAE